VAVPLTLLLLLVVMSELNAGPNAGVEGATKEERRKTQKKARADACVKPAIQMAFVHERYLIR
jgi:hypothetical protein